MRSVSSQTFSVGGSQLFNKLPKILTDGAMPARWVACLLLVEF